MKENSESLIDSFGDREKRIALCIPGGEFKKCFLASYTQLMVTSLMRRWAMFPILTSSSNVFHVRNSCLGKLKRTGEDERYGEPFEGVIPYTHILWIDSDQEFSVSHIDTLLDADLDFVSGWYLANSGGETVVTLPGDGVHAYKNQIKGKIDPFEVDSVGFGFVLMKKGVLEKIPYPWFTMEMDAQHTPMGEDVSFCTKARRAGIKLFVHPFVQVGHCKESILY